MAESPDPRFKSIMTSLVRKLHEFIREVDLSSAEWFTAIEFLTATGQACNDKRQEFILMSDTLGVSMMVVMLDQIRAIRESKGGTPRHRGQRGDRGHRRRPVLLAGRSRVPSGRRSG